MAEKRKRQWVREIVELGKIALICLLAAFLIKTFIAKPVRVEGESMYPTLQDGAFGFTSVISLSLGGINRGDIVIVRQGAEYWVKRVVALPNETIECRGDQIYIDGEVLSEDYLDARYRSDIRRQLGFFTEDFGPVTLGKEEYFLLGDNRGVSADSRSFGPFHRDQIIGKDLLVLLPFDQFGYHS